MGVLTAISALLRVLLGSRAGLAAENLALRQQLIVLQRSVKRPRPRRRDRVFWVLSLPKTPSAPYERGRDPHPATTSRLTRVGSIS